MTETRSYDENHADEPIEALQEPNRAGLILFLGILGIVVCVIFGIMAWTMAGNDLRKMQLGIMDPSGYGMTQAGKICGIISVILSVVGLILVVINK